MRLSDDQTELSTYIVLFVCSRAGPCPTGGQLSLAKWVMFQDKVNLWVIGSHPAMHVSCRVMSFIARTIIVSSRDMSLSTRTILVKPYCLQRGGQA